MKIEKINDNQIKCILTSEDLESRQIKLSELAYGSDKAKELFREMVQQANSQFGFEVEDIPLMVEAIPAASGNLTLLISKVEYPDELDTRFSRFSEPGDEYLEDSADKEEEIPIQGASDILDLFRKMEEEQKEPEEKTEPDHEQKSKQDEKKKPEIKKPADLVRITEFSSLSQVEQLAHILKGYYSGNSSLYKNAQNYILVMHKSTHTPEEFNKICNIAAEYGYQRNGSALSAAYLEEHADVIRRGDALEILAEF